MVKNAIEVNQFVPAAILAENHLRQNAQAVIAAIWKHVN